jgi:CubicO group peptidase (beta-lactamase class C family)
LIALCWHPVTGAERPHDAPPPACNRVRFFPAPGGEKAMVGGTFSGSNVSRTEGFQPLAELKAAPPANQWSELTFDNQKLYRWLRYVGPAGSQGKTAKVEFYAGDQLLTAPGHGVQYGSLEPGRLCVGYDLLDAVTARRPAFQPERTEQEGPVDITISSSRGAVIRYTLDGSWPTAEHGATYSQPLHIEKTTTLSAVALLDGRAPSPPVATTYLLRGSSRPGLSSAHVGNSLTGTTAGFWRYARTAGYDHKAVYFLRGGALTRELWALASGDFASDPQTSAKEAANLKKGSTPWADYWSKVGKVDLLTLQPRDFDLDKEVAAELNFIKLFRGKSPDVQPWLYCEWVEMARQRPSDKGVVPSSQMKKTFPALTWEESMGAMLLYVEELQQRLFAQQPEGKRPRVLPAALAMGWIKNLIDHGKFPGVQPGSFYPLLFNDQVHPAAGPVNGSANGAFLVDMTWFSAFYRQAPEGRVLPIETTFTPEQTLLVQRLAWDVIKNYPDCGLYEAGTTPCGRPEFVNAGKTITLSSSTPGAWFRYTLDGTTPTRACGYVYCGVISVQTGMTLKAIAYKSGMADSEVAEAAQPKPASGDLATVLQASVDKHLVAGAVGLVADKDKVLELAAAGYASLGAKTPMRTQDLFWLASMTKSITATALMMLVDEGKVNIADPVEKYLPEFKGQCVAAGKDTGPAHAPRHPITIREILSHTSGLVLASDPSLKNTYVLKDNVAKLAAAPLRQEPGTKFEYNNSGFDTAGRIIEVVSGLAYADFMQRRLFDPLGMQDTTFWPTAEQAQRLARSARFTADKTALEEVKLDKGLSQAVIDKLGQGVTAPPALLADFGVGSVLDYARHFAAPAGGLFSTASDVGKFCQMLLNGGVYQGQRYLSEAAVRQMTSIQTGDVPVNPQEAYGLGWYVKIRADEGPAVGSFGHRGARRPVMWVDPKNQLALVLLVERFDMPGDGQKELYSSFLQAAIEKYGKAR